MRGPATGSGLPARDALPSKPSREGHEPADSVGALRFAADERDPNAMATRIRAMGVSPKKAAGQHRDTYFSEQTLRKNRIVDRRLRPEIEGRIGHRARQRLCELRLQR